MNPSTPAHVALESSTCEFSEAMEETSLEQVITVTSGGATVPGVSAWDGNSRALTFVPTGAFSVGASRSTTLHSRCSLTRR